MNNTIRLYKELNKRNLITRGEGYPVKIRLELYVEHFEYVVIDFENINIITPSWVSEVLGDLAYNYGKKFLKNKIRVINANNHVKFVLNYTIDSILKLREKEKGEK